VGEEVKDAGRLGLPRGLKFVTGLVRIRMWGSFVRMWGM
jgi:hypothetical protein